MIRQFALMWLLTLTACNSKPTVDTTTTDEDPGLSASATTIDDLDQSQANLERDAAVWRWDDNTSMAVLGIPSGPPLFSVRCDKNTKTLIFTRFAAAPHGGRATLSLTAPDTVASLPATAAEVSPGQSSYWQATEKVDDLPAAAARAFSALGSLRISLGGAPALDIPHSDVPVKAFRVCGAAD